MTTGESGAKAPDRNRGRAQSGRPADQRPTKHNAWNAKQEEPKLRDHRFKDSQLFINRLTDTGIGVRSS